MTARKKPGERRAAAKKETRRKSAQETPAKPPAKRPPKKDPTRATPSKKLNAAQQATRDSLMIARLAQNWTWEAIAEEAGISVSAAKRAVKNRQDAAPLRLNTDPVKIVEQVFEAYQLSIGDFEAIAAEAARRENLAVAVGAKKGANEAREKVLTLLQLTNRLPQDLAALRHLIDLRALALRMLDVMDSFERGLQQIAIEEETKVLVNAEVLKVKTTFRELVGLGEEPEIEAARS